MKPIIIYGPTGVGKTDISLKLAKKYNAEIISCDSMQIYKYLDVGTAKISKNEMQGIQHHLIDFVEPNENYSVYQFVSDCKQIMEDIKKRNKNIVIVGGTGLYIKALIENYNMGEVNRENIKDEFKEKTNEQLVELIQKAGKELKQEDYNNRARLLRYAELCTSNSKVTKLDEADKYMLFGLTCDRTQLYNRINTRVDNMLKNGLLNEVEQIYKKYGENIQCFKAIGYKEFIPYFKGEINLDKCIELIKQHSRNYAKRQFTFMNQFKTIIKVDVKNVESAFLEIAQIVDDVNN